MAQETVVVPDIGGSEAAEVVEILVSVGEEVSLEQGLLVLESDKASMEIPSTVAGKVVEILAAVGDALGEGAAVAVIEVAGASAVATAPAGDSEVVPAAAAASDTVTAVPAKASDAAPAATTSAVIPVPDIGTDEAVDLIEIAVKVGDTVDEGDTLVVLESDKASMEVPAPRGGVVEELLVSEGQSVREGDPLLRLVTSAVGADSDSSAAATSGEGEGASTQRTESSTPAVPAQPPARGTATAGPPAGGEARGKVYAGPAVRRLAREFGIPLDQVAPTGPRGRLLKEDLHDYTRKKLQVAAQAASGAGIPEVPEVDFSAFGPVEVVERSKIDRVTAANMQRSWLNVPHVTQFDDADITELEAFRVSLKDEAAKRGTRMTPLPFLLKACAVALGSNEKLNASLSDGGQTLTYKRYVHIGIAVDTPSGLMVPVLRDVDRKGLWELAEEVLDLAERARDRKLKPQEMQGAGFTISSLGAIGGRGFTPIVNAPEVAILGVGRSDTRPVWDGQAFQPRLQLPLALSYDHRVVNGGDAGRFMTALCTLLGDLRRLML